MTIKTYSPWQTFRRLLGLGKPYVPWYVGLCLAKVLESGLAVGSVESIRRMVNGATTANMDLVRSGFFLALIVLGSEALVGFIQSFGGGLLDQISVMNLQVRVFRRVLNLKTTSLGAYHTGDVVSRVIDSASQAQTGVNGKVREILGYLLTLVFTLGYLAYLNPRLATGAMIIAGLMPLLANPLAKPLRRAYDKQHQAIADVNAFSQDAVQGGEVVRAFTLAQRFSGIHRKKQDEIIVLSRRALKWQILSHNVHFLVYIGGIFFIFGYGGVLVSQGTLDVGGVVAFMASFGQLSWPIAALAGIWPQFQQSISQANRVFEVWDLPQERETDHPLPIHGGDLAFSNLSFHYTEGEPVLSGVSFVAPQGKVTALVGPSGSGKSTILKLLLRLIEPGSGGIHSGGIPIDRFSLKDWRQITAYVSQDPTLFTGTIGENIRQGRPGARQEEVEDAARAAQIHEYIQSLPDGYETMLGERGMRLSGGERQRVAVARAILRDPRILLLDEATSSLDSENEVSLQQALNRLMQGRTTLVVAHRLSTIRDAHQIVYIEAGKVWEIGTHVELLELGGRYAAMYSRRFAEKREEGLA